MTDQEKVAGWQAEQVNAETADLLRWASKEFGQDLAFATSLGVEDQALTALIAEFAPEIPVFTLDTGRVFQESYVLLQETQKKYNLDIKVMFPQREAVETMVAEDGINLFYDSIAGRKRCCGVRKIEPLQRALKGNRAWITGLRGAQSVTRTGLPVVQWDGFNSLVKINPLAAWTEEQTWEYVRANDVPYNTLHDDGFLSIGCAPCTRAIKPGEDVRAGRWWWEQPEQKECGLHAR
jgi:phosphoadenosine phosphosulfate reductase